MILFILKNQSEWHIVCEEHGWSIRAGDCQVGLLTILPVFLLMVSSGIGKIILPPSPSFFFSQYLSASQVCERARNCLHKPFWLIFLILFLKTLSGNVLTQCCASVWIFRFSVHFPWFWETLTEAISVNGKGDLITVNQSYLKGNFLVSCVYLVNLWLL